MSLTWFDGVQLTLEAALSASTGSYGAWNAGLWGTATWGPEILYQDVSPFFRSMKTSRGFGREVQAWQAGTAMAVLSNRDARFSPSNLTGPYVVAGVTGIRPWRPLRFRATYAGITYDVYTGYVTDWLEAWADGHADATVTLPCVDEYARLAAVEGAEVPAIGGGESSGQRVHRLLDAAGHTGPRNVDMGSITVQPTTLSTTTTTELELTADSEGGAAYVTADGVVTFDRQNALLEETRSNTIQAVFGDGTGSELPCRDIQVAYVGDLLSNAAAFSRVGGLPQTSLDNTSQALYGPRRKTRTDLICEADTQVQGLADWWVARYKDPELRVTQLKVKPRSNPARLFPQVLGLRVRDLVRVVARPIGGRTITRDCFIAGISHEISQDDWTTTIDLWSATPYTSYVTSRWDVATWDGATWFY